MSETQKPNFQDIEDIVTEHQGALYGPAGEPVSPDQALLIQEHQDRIRKIPPQTDDAAITQEVGSPNEATVKSSDVQFSFGKKSDGPNTPKAGSPQPGLKDLIKEKSEKKLPRTIRMPRGMPFPASEVQSVEELQAALLAGMQQPQLPEVQPEPAEAVKSQRDFQLKEEPPMPIAAHEVPLSPSERRSGEEESTKKTTKNTEITTAERGAQAQDQLQSVLEELESLGYNTPQARIVEIVKPKKGYQKRLGVSRSRNKDSDFVYHSGLQRPRPATRSGRYIHRVKPKRIGYQSTDYVTGWVIPNSILDPRLANQYRDTEFSKHNAFVITPVTKGAGNLDIKVFQRFSWVEKIDGKNPGLAVVGKEEQSFDSLPLPLRENAIHYLKFYINEAKRAKS